jgi:cyclic di-GMP phosphodiesterase
MKNTTATGTQQQVEAKAARDTDHPIVCALTATLRLRDVETQSHCERVVRLSLLLGREFGLDQAQMKALEYEALLHDIGKIGIPDYILRKPGRLTAEEWTIMRKHPSLGLHLLSGIESLKGAALVVAQHHERWDGRGYPFGLRSDEIDLNARIFTVIDSFDAMTSNRVYQISKTFDAALAELKRSAGQQFDPEVVEAFTGIQQEIWTSCAA